MVKLAGWPGEQTRGGDTASSPRNSSDPASWRLRPGELLSEPSHWRQEGV